MIKPKKLDLLSIIGIILIIIIGYNAYKIIFWKIDTSKNEVIKKELKGSINKNIVNFKYLKKKNKDTIAYIKVNNTNINYVVVKTDNNKYYLNHNFNKEENVAGWIFADYHNKFDETDKNIIIYGHNMQDGSMFETLKNVLNKDWYTNKDNEIITLITEQGIYKYKVFSTYSIKAEDYYITTNFNNDEEFGKFINKLKNRSIYNYNVDVSSTDKILTLSSCIGDGKNRVVLHSKLIEKTK